MKKLLTVVFVCITLLALICGCEAVHEREEPLDALGKAEYSEEEIEKLANSNLTLDEAADKINTVTDAMNYLTICGYKEDFSYNPSSVDENETEWMWNMSAQFTYDHMAGTCGGTSNLFNYLLKDDYDEEGYVLLTGHIMNYFKDNDVYYFCDFAGPWFVENPDKVLLCSTEEPRDFVNAYMEFMPEADDIDSDAYLTYIYMYARNGEDALPESNFEAYIVDEELEEDYDDETCCVGVPDSAEKLVVLLERDGYIVKAVPVSIDNLKPEEIHIPNDEGDFVN